jgi:hypothetical protein
LKERKTFSYLSTTRGATTTPTNRAQINPYTSI